MVTKQSQVYYAASTNGFYHWGIHGTKIPPDAKIISRETWDDMLLKMCSGHVIKPGEDGLPTAVPFELSREQKAQTIRRARANLLHMSDGLVARHRDEHEMADQAGVYMVNATTLTGEQYTALQEWRRALRELPQDPDFPDVDIPECPVKIGDK